MKKKFQVFVSSTFTDLREERQAAVEAILKAGHIPAGMELFTAGSESQLEVIKQWIRDSDIYVLILGGRYGSVEPKSGLSYTEVEFDYAKELGKPFFSVVLTEEGREAKVKAHGTSAIEQENLGKWKTFRARVLTHMCAMFASPKDVKLAVFETLPQLTSSVNLVGWVPASEVGPSNELGAELARTLEENRSLRAGVERLNRDLDKARQNGASFEDLYQLLAAERVPIPAELNGGKKSDQPLLDLCLACADDLARGVSNSINSTKRETFLMFNVASQLVSFGLAEHDKVPSEVQWQRLRLSKEGVKFLNWARLRLKTASEQSAAVGGAGAAQKGAEEAAKRKPQGAKSQKREAPSAKKKWSPAPVAVKGATTPATGVPSKSPAR